MQDLKNERMSYECIYTRKVSTVVVYLNTYGQKFSILTNYAERFLRYYDKTFQSLPTKKDPHSLRED